MRSIANTFHISRNTVRKYVRCYQESGMSLDRLLRLSDEHIQEMFADRRTRERKPSPRQVELEALLPDYAKRLSYKGITVQSIVTSKLFFNNFQKS